MIIKMIKKLGKMLNEWNRRVTKVYKKVGIWYFIILNIVYNSASSVICFFIFPQTFTLAKVSKSFFQVLIAMILLSKTYDIWWKK